MKEIQIEITQLDIFVTDGKGGAPYRPWLELGIDLQTGEMVEIQLYKILPHANSIRAFFKSFFAGKKSDTLPRAVVVDNSFVASGSSLVALCQKHGINVEHLPLYRPSFKTWAEKLIGDVHKHFNNKLRPLLTLPELEKIILKITSRSRK